MKKLTLFFAIPLFVCLTLGSDCGNPTPNPNLGFYMTVRANGLQTGARVIGTFLSGSPTQGTVSNFDYPSINGVGLHPATGARVPGTWRLTYGPSFDGGSLCLGYLTTDRSVSPGSVVNLDCIPRFFSLNAAPDAIDAFNPPATVDAFGDGAESLQGTPMVAFRDEYGNVVASGAASELIYDKGTVVGVRVNVGSLSNAFDGTYTGLIHNVNPDGSWDLVAAAAISIYGNPRPIDPPPDPGDGNCDQDPHLPACEPPMNY